MEQKAVYIGPCQERHGDIVTLRPHPQAAGLVLCMREKACFEFTDRASNYRILSDVTSPAPATRDTPDSERMVYVGQNRALFSKTAIVRPHPIYPLYLLARFDDVNARRALGEWADMPSALFSPIGIGYGPDLSQPDPHIEPDAWPWLLAGIGLSGMPAESAPTEPARKVHRLGRLFDDAPARTPVNHGPAPTSMMRVLDGEQWGAAVLVREKGE